MERKKANFTSGKRPLFFAVMALIILSAFAAALSFTTSPQINNNQVTYTKNDLICVWVSDDASQTNVSWYNNSVLFWNGTVSGNSSTIDDQYTTKNDDWICQVTISNGTSTVAANASMSINNTAPSVPVMKNSTAAISNYYNLTEDLGYTFYIYSTDDDGDTLSYDMTDANIYDLCTMEDTSTGELFCNASHSVITNSTALGSETQKNHTLRMYSTESGTSGYTAYADFIFTLIPVNDQPYVTQSISTQTVNAGAFWNVTVNADDEELNYPINFTVSGVMNNNTDNVTLGFTITNTSNKTANISFSGSTTNEHAGLWNITVNMTDINGANSSRLPSQYMFYLQINSSNFAPNFTNNFSIIGNTSWTQGNSMLVLLYGNDSNDGDTVYFNVTPPSNTSLRCSVATFPWTGNITAISTSYLNASGYINVSNLTNDFVACRYVNLVIYDQLKSSTTVANFLLNISNTNDAPVMYEIGLDGNMSNISAKKFQSSTYRINASDPDSLTYDLAATANLSYYSNSSLFPVNLTTGAVTIYPYNDSFVGDWAVNLTVSDGEFNSSRIMYISVSNNSVPVLNLSYNNITFQQNDNITINFSAVENDNETMSMSFSSLTDFADSTYSSSFVLLNNSYDDGVNTEYRTLNMSRLTAIERNRLVGNHMITVTFEDVYGSYFEGTSTGVINFTILNENDAPFFDLNRDNVSDTVSFGTVVYNVSYSIMLNATDFDMFLEDSNETLTFSYSNPSAGLENISLENVSGYNYSARLNFTGATEGVHSINITVSDSSGANTSQIVSFTVLARTSAPVIHTIKPYFNTTQNMTIFSFANTSLYSNNQTSINTSENHTVVFDARATNDTVSGNYMSYYWYFDGELESSLVNITPTVNSAFSKYFDFFTSNSTHNVTLIARDARYSESAWTWLVNVTDVNRPPVYCSGHLEDLTINGTTIISNYLSYSDGAQRFYDPDDDPDNNGEGEDMTCDDYWTEYLDSITFTIYETYPCEIIDFAFDGADITIDPSLTGLCQVQFNATDEYGETVLSSDVVDIVVVSTGSTSDSSSSSSSGGSTTRTRTVAVPYDQEVDTPKPIEVVAPASVTTYANKTLYIPLKIKNTWTTDISGVDLSGASLNATMANQSNVTFSFDQTYFNVIPSGAEYDVTLAVSNYRTEGPFEIVVTATVKDPEFNDSATVLISTLEQTSEGEAVKTKITFAKDLISENPSCRELNELLEKADSEIYSGNAEEALKLVDGAINGCKYLMEKEQVRSETQSVVKKWFDAAREYTVEIIAGAGLLLILTLILYAIAALKKKLSEQ